MSRGASTRISGLSFDKHRQSCCELPFRHQIGKSFSVLVPRCTVGKKRNPNKNIYVFAFGGHGKSGRMSFGEKLQQAPKGETDGSFRYFCRKVPMRYAKLHDATRDRWSPPLAVSIRTFDFIKR